MKDCKHIKTEKLSGEIMITDLKGVFLNGYSVNNGKLIAQYKSKVKKNKASLFFSSSISAFFQNSGTCQYHGPCYDGSECIMCNQNLEEVFLIAGGSTDAGILVTNIYFNGPSGGGDFNDAKETISWIAGGESGGGFEDEEDDPCTKIANQIANTAFKAKLDLLKTKTGLKKETGFVQNKNGTFETLTVSATGHNLRIPMGSTRIGYLHTHLDNFLNGKTDPKTGAPIEIQPIRMLSPNDVNTFLIMVKNAKTSGYPTSKIFGTMVSSSGTYTIRFTGDTSNLNDIKTDYTKEEMRELSKIFRDKYVNKWGNERGFLKYLKHKIGVTGISLYKIKSSGRIRPLTLNGTKEKLERGDCE